MRVASTKTHIYHSGVWAIHLAGPSKVRHPAESGVISMHLGLNRKSAQGTCLYFRL